MNEKEKAMEIFNQALKNAQEVFDKYVLCEIGTYTVKELCNRRATRYNSDAFGGDVKYRIEVGAYRSEYYADMAFSELAVAARDAGVKCPVFTRRPEGEPSFTFTADFPKETKHLANFVAKTNLRPLLCYIYLDVANSTMAASDGTVFEAMHVEIPNIEGTIPSRTGAYLSPDIAKMLSGRCTVRVFRIESYIETEFIDEQGTVYATCLENGVYPDYKTIYPKLSYENGYIKFSASEVKRLAKWVKSDIVLFEVGENSDTVKVSCGRSCDEFALDCKGDSCKMNIAFKAEKLKIACKSGWDGGIWFTDSENSAVFDCEGADVTIIMPCYQEGAERIKIPYTELNISATARRDFLGQGAETETAPAKEEARQGADKTEPAETVAVSESETGEDAPTEDASQERIKELALMYGMSVYTIQLLFKQGAIH